MEKVILGAQKEKCFQVGTELPSAKKVQLLAFLRNNLDVFAWSMYEVPKVDLDFICHHLNVNPTVIPRKQ